MLCAQLQSARRCAGQLSGVNVVNAMCALCLQGNAFSSVSTLRLLGGLLAPYCSMLTYSTRLTEMRRLVNDIIAPIAAQLAQQKHSQLAKLGCTVEEAPPGSMPADGKGISVAVGNQGRNLCSTSSSNGASSAPGLANGSSSIGAVAPPAPAAFLSSGSLKQRKGGGSKGAGSAAGGKSSSKGAGSHAASAAVQCSSNGTPQVESQALSHKRFESGKRLWLSTLWVCPARMLIALIVSRCSAACKYDSVFSYSFSLAC